MSEGRAAPPLKLKAGGTLNPRRHLYIERPEDAELLRLLLAAEYVNVLTSRQMGKSSLMVKTMLALREHGVRTASIDLAAELGGADDAGIWFRGLLNRLARELKLDLDIGGWWAAHPSDAVGQRLQRFFREIVCQRISGPVVVFLDEIDSTLKHAFIDALFTAIRGMYNERGLETAYEWVTFCLLGVATPNELIKDRRTTAYNVGQTLELRDFEGCADKLRPLADSLSLDRATSGALLERVLYWSGGHPYLTVKLCADLGQRRCASTTEVDSYVERTFSNLKRLAHDIHFEQVLRFLDLRLSQVDQSLRLYERLLAGELTRDEPTLAHAELKLSGLVKRGADGSLVVRNRIYERLFDRQWLQSALPIPPIDFEALSQLGVRVSGDPATGFELALPRAAADPILGAAVDALSDPSVVRSLDLGRTNVTGVEPLRRLTALQALDLSYTQVSGIEPLQELTSLQSLDLSHTKITSIEALRGLTALQTLNLWESQVSDLKPLQALAALRTLDLSFTRVSNLEALRGLTALQSLSAWQIQIGDLEPLGGLTRLQTLDLPFTQVSSLDPLRQLTSLQTLDLWQTQVSDLEPISGLIDLQTLNLSFTKVNSLEPLRGLTALRRLNLSFTQVSGVRAAPRTVGPSNA